MIELKVVFKFLFETVCILLVIVVFGFIGLCCFFYTPWAHSLRWKYAEPKIQKLREYHSPKIQLYCALVEFPWTALNISRDTEFDPNEMKNLEMKDLEIKNLFEVKKLLLEPKHTTNWYRLFKDHYEKLREESKNLYLNPDIDLWRQYIAEFGGEKFEDRNEFALILCIPEGIFEGQFAKITFSEDFDIFDSLPAYSIPEEWLEPNAWAQKEWELYEQNLLSSASTAKELEN